MSSKIDIDNQKRQFLTTVLRWMGGIGAAFALLPLVSSLKPDRRILAENGTMDVDLQALQPGQQMTLMWRGKPIWILRRTPEMLAQLQHPNPELRDPHSLVDQQPPFAKNVFRSLCPEYLVLVGVCTHLGCIPELKGACYDCPCHGSKFDLAGRVYRHVPAPINLEVPVYKFIHPKMIRLGESP